MVFLTVLNGQNFQKRSKKLKKEHFSFNDVIFLDFLDVFQRQNEKNRRFFIRKKNPIFCVLSLKNVQKKSKKVHFFDLNHELLYTIEFKKTLIFSVLPLKSVKKVKKCHFFWIFMRLGVHEVTNPHTGIRFWFDFASMRNGLGVGHFASMRNQIVPMSPKWRYKKKFCTQKNVEKFDKKIFFWVFGFFWKKIHFWFLLCIKK